MNSSDGTWLRSRIPITLAPQKISQNVLLKVRQYSDNTRHCSPSLNDQKPSESLDTPGPPPQTNHPEIVLLHETVQPLFKGAVDSVYDVHQSQRDMVEKQLSSLAAGGQKVLTCQYGPRNAVTPEGFKDYSFWYPAPPPDLMKYMLSTFGHPFMRLGLISVTKCPSTAAGAELLFRQRFN